MRLEAAEQLRSQAHELALGGGGGPTAHLSATAALSDGAAAQIAWSSFVPFLAHPVTAAGARDAMRVIETAATSEVSLA